ncbi:MAG: phytase [Phycisphaerae bacterium]|nr:phytase [Gemmatimonadaceae bacterium]
MIRACACFTVVASIIVACDGAKTPPATVATTTPSALPLSTDTLQPAIITDTLPGDSDDPAIWMNTDNPAASLVLGTDKGDSTGGVYVFGLDGRIDRRRSVTPLQRMNNVDVEYGMSFGGVVRDIAVATERRRMAIRVFTLPDMRAVDGKGITVFDGDTARAPMGVALYKRPRDGQIFAFVGGKSGPTSGTYLAQYALRLDGARVVATKVREFGKYSGRKEIESIFVDDALGFVYYSDEGVGVRKYHADPDSTPTELALFATSGVTEDHEGIALYAKDALTGYLVLSDQGSNRIHVFPREGMAGNPHSHPVLAIIPVRAQQTDGLDVTSASLGPAFPKGMLAMMSNRGAFHFYRWEDVEAAIDRTRASAK